MVKSTGPPTALGLRILILETDTVVLTTATSLSTDPPLPPSPKTLTPRPVVNNQALPVETPTATAGTCLDVGLVSQTTTTDQSLIFLPGEPFYYSWRILNIGSCIWTVDYQLLSIDASKLGWPNIIRLPNQVPPGETATVITTFFAPQTQGVVAAEWVLTNPEGEPVLIKSSSGENLDLSITVRRKISGKDNDNPEECT